jgi:RNA polymerase sigma-70 factor (ECF subfamily)
MHITLMMPDSDHHADFIRLLNAVHRRLLAYLVSLLGNRHDAEDVLQRASVTMWRRFYSFDASRTTVNEDFLSWACTVAFYEAKNFQRAAARSRLQFSEELLAIVAEERVADLSSVDDRAAALEHCLGRLDDASQRLVEAAYFEEGSLLKLAEQLGRAPQTLYNKLNIIRRKLAECVMQRLASEGGAV